MFEVVYGLVLDIVGKDIVNFVGLIYVVCLMLEYVGQLEIVVLIMNVMLRVLEDGIYMVDIVSE